MENELEKALQVIEQDKASSLVTLKEVKALFKDSPLTAK